ARARRHRRRGDGQRRAGHPSGHHRPARQAGCGLSGQRLHFPRDRTRRGPWADGRSVDGEIDEARVAQARRRFSRLRSVRARAPRHPDFPDVPAGRDPAKNEAARALIELAELPYAMSRPFAAPPDLPRDRAKALQRAFLAMHEDPQYLEDAAKLRIDVSPIGGDGVLRAIDGIGNAPPELLEYVRKLLAETRGGR